MVDRILVSPDWSINSDDFYIHPQQPHSSQYTQITVDLKRRLKLVVRIFKGVPVERIEMF